MQGHSDSSLTPLGRQQAGRAGDGINLIEAAYTSPSSRAKETAGIILGGQRLTIHEMPEFKEINLGPWEGMARTEVAARYDREYETFWSKPSAFFLEGAETFQAVQQRAVSAFFDIVRSNREKSILLVSHTVTIKVLLAWFENRPMDRIWDPPFLENGGYSRIEEIHSDQFKVVLYGGVPV